jgi:hypothetical protein
MLNSILTEVGRLRRKFAWTVLLAAAPGALPAQTPAVHGTLVELFTSQGCSSCPPADRLLARLGQESEGKIIPLAFHVDSWNHAGWTDRFSSHEWTLRQLTYGRALYLNQVYTPQAVIDGRVEMVGSNEAKVRSALAVSATLPAGAISLKLEPEDSRVGVQADVTVPETLRSEKLDLMMAVFETDLVTPVGSGENGGKTLRDEYVVRSLRRADRLPAGGPSHSVHAADLPLEKEWNRAHLGVAAFLQDPHSLAVRGAAASFLTPRASAQ